MQREGLLLPKHGVVILRFWNRYGEQRLHVYRGVFSPSERPSEQLYLVECRRSLS